MVWLNGCSQYFLMHRIIMRTLLFLLSVTGILYASLIAIKQKQYEACNCLFFYSAYWANVRCFFSQRSLGTEGMMIQMFNHGINIIGLWIVANAVEKITGSYHFSDLGGLAQKAPSLAILFVIMSLANIALPLTNAFVGEFLMFNGLFQYNAWVGLAAGISIILAAVYTLNMIQKVFYGNTVPATVNARDSHGAINFALIMLTVLIFGFRSVSATYFAVDARQCKSCIYEYTLRDLKQNERNYSFGCIWNCNDALQCFFKK